MADANRWDLDGHLAGAGSPWGLDDLPFDRLCAFTWWFFTKEADAQGREKFRVQLWIPPTKDTPIPPESPWSAENETKALKALKAGTTGG